MKLNKIKFVVPVIIIAIIIMIGAAFYRQYEVSKWSTNPWNDKSWNAVGDSITYQGLYVKKVSKATGLNGRKYAVNGSTIAINNSYKKNVSILERIKGLNGNNAAKDADLWTVFGGTNDWYLSVPIGTMNSTDNTTFYGAWNEICQYITRRPNHPKIIIFTPLQSKRVGKNENGDTMNAYREAILNIGKQYSIPVVDLYKYGGINQTNLYQSTKDGVHPNKAGTKLYYPKIVQAISQLK